jgi:thiamine kinase-like enzyme
MTKYPESLSQLSAPFLNHILKQRNIIRKEASVEKFHYQLLQGGVHYSVARVFLEYNNDDVGCPRSVIVKMIHDKNMTTSEKLKTFMKKKFPMIPFFKDVEDIIARLNSYEIELRFYRNMATELTIPTPKCYFNHEDYYNVYFFICLEDLSDYVIGQPDGFSFESSKEILKNVAQFHYSFWNNPHFSKNGNHVWEHGGYWFGEKEMDHTRSIEMSWNKSLENIGHLLSSELINKIPDLGKKLESASNFVTESVHNFQPRTLVHGDYKISNLFFDSRLNRVYTIDWQWLGKGNAATDVFYYIYTSTFSFYKKENENRTEEIEELLRKYPYYNPLEMELIYCYWSELIKNGVNQTEYPFEQFELQYMMNVIYFTMFCIRQKYYWMKPEDIERYKTNKTDGLHLRSIEHIEQLLSRCHTFLDHINRDSSTQNII